MYLRNEIQVDHDACGVGFIAQLGSRGSHDVVERALEALRRLSHRGGVDADGRSGDGAGLLTAVPERLLRNRARRAGLDLPPVFGVGMVFLPRQQQIEARKVIESCAAAAGLSCVWWRTVPTDVTVLGPRATDTLPLVEQCFFAPSGDNADFETQLFRLRKRCESEAPAGTYFCSLSSRTVVYKGLLTPSQLPIFYPDLLDAEFESSFAIFHQRYSTNTQPSWSLAQPFRFVAHNGEINTVRANRRWLRAKEPALQRELGIAREVRLFERGVSDSASLDNAAEVMLRRGYSAAAALHCLMPAVCDEALQPAVRDLVQQHVALQEAWDGPAAIIFTDGHVVGAKLDRNGLRPLRYTLTADGLLIVGSEAGIAELRGKRVIERQRLGPGEMLTLSLDTGAIARPRETPELVVPAGKRANNSSAFPSVRVIQPTPSSSDAAKPSSAHADARETPAPSADAKRLLGAMGWSEDRFRMLFQPLVQKGQEAIWSMGDDAPPACISQLRRPVWDYCKQRFAQVTNPPIDPLRERHVMSLDVWFGDIALRSPLLDAGQLEELRSAGEFVCIDITFAANGGTEAAEAALERIAREAIAAGARQPRAVLVTDRAVDAEHAAVPALLASSAAWRAMSETGGCDVPLIVETGQAFDPHHVALLVAAGASAVFPYLAFEHAAALQPDGPTNYRAAVEYGLRKVLARMGISALSSYRNGHLFEVIGVDAGVATRFFEDADCIPGGTTLGELLQDAIDHHSAAYGEDNTALRDNGYYRFRREGEQHASSPEVVRRLHKFVKSPSGDHFRAYSELSSERQPVSLRDLLETVGGNPIPLREVESEASLLSRFSTQAMSLGAISPEAHRTLAIAMNRLGGRSNTGEGGEDPDIYRNCPEANNRVKQVASGRFGVTAEYLVQADELEIKMAQGSKPGEGGQLPATKVTEYIARLRHAVPNMSLISPPPHHDIYSIEDLAQLIYDLRAVNPKARIGVKLVSGAGVGIIAAGVVKAGADVITISGHDGGTGASPLSSITNTGLPWEIGLRDAHTTLVRTGLRSRVRLRVDGGFKFSRDVIVAALLGADEFGFGTAALLAIGCVMARQCHLNTCPVGIATQDEKLRARFAGNPEMVENFFRATAAEVRETLASLGVRSIDDLRGAVRLLKPKTEDAAPLVGRLLEPDPAGSHHRAYPREEAPGLHLALNRTLEERESLDGGSHRFRITTADLSIGAHLSGEIARGASPAPSDGPAEYEFVGTAGQSFGAFLTSGVKFRLLGEANDYVGKGLSGGTIAISAGSEACERGDVLVGNTVLYGATSGELYVAGRAGERFAVRNSGALAVVEGVGQHGCEYMTGGIVLVLGPTGTNLGAGMTGGLSYVLQPEAGAESIRYNQQSVRLVPLEAPEELWLRLVLRRHFRLTGSQRALNLQDRRNALPLLRVEPVQPPCPIAETWAPVLERIRSAEALLSQTSPLYSSDGSLIV